MYQSENFLYRPFQFKSYGNQYLSALTNHLQDENTIEIHLLNNDTQTIKNLKVYTDTPTVSAYENDIIMIGYGMDQYYGKQLITKINLKTGQTSNLSFGKSYDPISNMNLIDINRNKYVAVGWNTLLAVGDFSEDISAPQIKITSQGGTFQNYDYYTLEWTCSDNLNELIRFEIYEEINNQSRLIKSIDDTSVRSLDYYFSKSDTNVTLSVHAYDNRIGLEEVLYILKTLSDIKSNNISLDHGLVAYYPFNGNANDESGNGNDGVVNGATLTIDRYGNNDSAYLFDGDNDYINVKDSSSLDISSTITISCWIKTKGSASYSGIINKVDEGDSNRNGYIVTINSKFIIHSQRIISEL
ncbi:hypothetical protein MHK_000504 [Candidatus Magnetomorum sp. HK-1]|nr:hypothetical protein MHK_000504 [Candidatus Magnetomorum sp. HK-1]